MAWYISYVKEASSKMVNPECLNGSIRVSVHMIESA